jgi:Na+-transporting methylmalonyl-CoA/oxaloacetate decarboxylase gamma subunit
MMGFGQGLGLGLMGLLIILVYLAILCLSIYVMISMISFFKTKSQNDRELLYKLDELVKLQTQQKEIQQKEIQPD